MLKKILTLAAWAAFGVLVLGTLALLVLPLSVVLTMAAWAAIGFFALGILTVIMLPVYLTVWQAKGTNEP